MNEPTDVLRKTREVRYWNKHAAKFDHAMSGVNNIYERITTKIVNHANRESDVLEVASGTGNISMAVAPHARSIQACDLS